MKPVNASCLPESSSLADLSEAVHERVACMMNQLPILWPSSIEADSSEDDEPIPTHSQHKPLKSDKLHRADTQVLHHVYGTRKASHQGSDGQSSGGIDG